MFSEDTGEAYDYLSADKAFSVISKKIHPITDKRYYVCPVCHNGMYLTDTRFRETKCLYCREPLQKELASTEIFERLEDRIKKMSSRAYIMGEEESDE